MSHGASHEWGEVLNSPLPRFEDGSIYLNSKATYFIPGCLLETEFLS